MPIVADELGGLELYGWVFTAFMLGSLIGIVVSGGLIDGRGLGRTFAGQQGSASSALSLTASLGTALGTGVTGALVAASVRADGTVVSGLVAGFGVAIGVGLVGLGPSGRLAAARPSDSTATSDHPRGRMPRLLR